MPITFESELRPNAMSLPLCVNSGQVFRWKQRPDGSWLGVDGGNWYVIRESGLRLYVETNGSEAAFERLFRLDWDERDVHKKLLKLGPELAPYIEALNGLRVMRPSEPSETFFCFLCTPNNNVTRITSMVRHLATYGEDLDRVDGEIVHRFPSIETIARIEETDLRAKSFGYRGGTIPRIAQQLEERGGREYLAGLKKLPYEESHQALCTFKGIGPKLADCIALFALDQMDAVPVDTHLWQAATRLYFPQWKDAALTDLKYREIGRFFRERFGDLAGWAHQYLFYDNLLNWRSRR